MMYSAPRWWILGAGALWIPWASSSPTALSIQPSDSWYGIDGSWSAITIGVGTGSPRQWVDVMVSTVSSETWVVGAGGCALSDSLCIAMRGKLFFPYNSSTWNSVGRFNLGTDQDLGNYGYADYGLDSLTLGTTGDTIPSSIIGAFNGTGKMNSTFYLTGFFGVGVVDGTFSNNVTPLSVLNALVQTEGYIPSHSYGFTAGAVYQQKGEPTSLTLGGYDAARFIPHNSTFSLNSNQQPEAFLQGISITSALASSKLNNSAPLLTSADQVNAIIDSSTPYLWLPQSVCERFAVALGLTYDNTLNLYTFDGNDSQHDILTKSELYFTFSLADMVSTTPNVNITVPYAAFDLQLTWPAIPNTNFGDANATRNYFPLRQADNDAQYRIGRAFLQEAYIITDYERNYFGVYQAVHPADPLGSTNIVTITRPSSSNLAGPPSNSSITTAAIVGIAVSVVVLIFLLIFAIIFFHKRQRDQKDHDESDRKPVLTQPRTLLDRLLRRPCEPLIHEASGSHNYASEIAGDERFELPAPHRPVELDSDSGTWEGTTEHGSSTQDSANLSAYDRVRRKFERQQAAAAALLRPPAHETYPVEKNENDVSHVVHYRPLDIASPLVSPMCGDNADSSTIDDQSSPVSTGFVSPPISPMGPPPMYRRINPANVVYAGRLPDNVQLPAVVPRLVGSDGRTVRIAGTMSTQPAGTNSSLGSQFTDHEAAMVEDLYGSGNSNIVSPIASGSNGSGNTNIVSPITSDDTGSRTTNILSHVTSGSTSKGSGTGTEENSTDTNIVSTIPSTSTESSDSRGFHVRGGSEIEIDRNLNTSDPGPWPSRRRLDSEVLVHVPQLPENRYSWESGREERSS